MNEVKEVKSIKFEFNGKKVRGVLFSFKEINNNNLTIQFANVYFNYALYRVVKILAYEENDPMRCYPEEEETIKCSLIKRCICREVEWYFAFSGYIEGIQRFIHKNVKSRNFDVEIHYTYKKTFDEIPEGERYNSKSIKEEVFILGENSLYMFSNINSKEAIVYRYHNDDKENIRKALDTDPNIEKI